MLTQINQRYLKVVIFILSLVPIFYILYQIITNQLGPEPIKDITHHTGKWTLYFIIITLAMTPLKKITKLNIWINYRRMFGLFIFFYASVHLMIYVGLDYRFDLTSIGNDIVKKKYIFIGFSAWLLLIPLVLTSNKWMVGHTFAASGMLSIEMGIYMLQHNRFIDNPFYKNKAILEIKLKTILINAVGFGGNAVSIIISKP